MSDLPPGSNGGSGHPVSHSQPADAGHGHFMNTRSPKFASITTDVLPPRRRAKNALHYAECRIMPNRNQDLRFGAWSASIRMKGLGMIRMAKAASGRPVVRHPAGIESV